MDYILKDIEPKRVFRHFEEITRIPHSSTNEAALSRAILEKAASKGLKAQRDEANNVYVFKEATPGYENRKRVILQAHIDMVAVKEKDCQVDLDREALPIYIEGDWLKSKGTSLGADDGIGAAMMLALMESDDIPHPPLEFIFTTMEEIGLIGARSVTADMLQGEYLINLDGGSDMASLAQSCAGSSENRFYFPGDTYPLGERENNTALSFAIDPLNGGHSGGRASDFVANAIILLGALLSCLQKLSPFELAEISGGGKMNAIADEARAVIVVPAENAAAVRNAAEEWGSLAKEQVRVTDPDMRLVVDDAPLPEFCYNQKGAGELIGLLEVLPNNAFDFFNSAKQIAKASSNAGILKAEGGKLVLICKLRSNSDHLHDRYISRFERLAKAFDAEFETLNRYGAWEYDPEGALLKLYVKLVKEEYGVDPLPVLTHGGLEPGVLIAAAKAGGKKLSAIAFGAKGEEYHTTRERLYIPSVGRVFDWLCRVLISLD